MNSCQGLDQRIADLLEPRREVLEAYLFGSHARGEAQPHSDLDIAVYIDEEAAEKSPYGYRAQLATDLIAGLHNNDIDLLILNQAPPVLYYHVLRDGIRVLSRDLKGDDDAGRVRGFPLLRLRAPPRQDGSGLAFRLRERKMSPGQPNPSVVRRHLTALRLAVENLRRHSGATAARLREDSDLRWSVERGLQLCAQNSLDIATHMALSAGMDAPDYATAIDRLAETGVLPRDFAKRFRGVAGFRNVLVHGYLNVDLDLIARFLDRQLGDFETFSRHVDRWLSKPTETDEGPQ